MRLRSLPHVAALAIVIASPAPAAAQEEAGLPSGRSGTYRTLDEYTQEMRDLAVSNPDLVRSLELPYRTFEGRAVEGLEITTDPQTVQDGKPVFLLMGLHHAREWPSGELALEWAYELVAGYRRGDAQLQALVEQTRTIIVPVVSPDGFNQSRAAGEQNGHGAGAAQDFSGKNQDEWRRKNCHVPGSATGTCPVGESFTGVDVNRNYGGFWYGRRPGSDEEYPGTRPFSEPETRNVRHLVTTRAVTMLISNHTLGGAVLRPTGQPEIAKAVADARMYKALGARLAAENG